MAATPYFPNRSGQKKPRANFNQYGINAGGPLWIPKIYNGRNRLFWFFAYEGLRNMAATLAGANAMPRPLFYAASSAAAVAWVMIYSLASYALGEAFADLASSAAIALFLNRSTAVS